MKVKTSWLTVSTTATQLAAANPDRVHLEFYANGQIFTIGDASVTTSGTGFLASSVKLDGLASTAEIYGICSGPTVITVLEIIPS